VLVRLRAVGLAGELSYILPLTQEVMAEVLGLSARHVNRMVRCLREENLVTIEEQHVVIHDIVSLSSLAGFEETILSRGGSRAFPRVRSFLATRRQPQRDDLRLAPAESPPLHRNPFAGH